MRFVPGNENSAYGLRIQFGTGCVGNPCEPAPAITNINGVDSNNLIAGAAITINPNYFDADGQFFNPNLPGYDTIFLKVMLHELGHLHRLDHSRESNPCTNQVRGATIMNGACNPNDYNGPGQEGNVPTEITSCDAQSVDVSYPEPTCQDNDGDGWTTCSGDCNDYAYSPYNDCGTFCWEQQFPCNYDQYWNPELCACSCATAFCTPILIDTAGDGFQLTSAAGGVSFDLAGDGSVDQVAWTAADSDDAWLALDRNGNGVIDGGVELFGGVALQPPSAAPNGFRALAEFDKLENGGNGDDVIDNRDAVFSSLRLWRDANHDGISDSSELHDLPSADVAVLHLKYKESKRTDEHGNQFRYRAKVSDSKGAKVGRWAWDVILNKAGN